MILARWIRIAIAALLVLVVTAPLSAQDGEVTLSASIRSEVDDLGVLVLHYPGDWVGEDSGGGEITVATRPALLDTDPSESSFVLQPGEAWGGAQRLRVGQYTGWGLTVDASPTKVIAGLITTADEEDELTLGKVEEFDAHGVRAGIATGTITIEDDYYGIIVTAITLDEQVIAGYLVAPKAEIIDRIPLARTMIAQVEFRLLADLTQSATVTVPDVGALTLYFPAGWVVETDDESVSIASDQATLEKALSGDQETLNRGEVAAFAVPLQGGMFSYLGLDDEQSPVAALTVIIDDLRSDNEADARFDRDYNLFEVNGRAAAMVTGTVRNEAGILGTIFTAIETQGGVAILLFVTHPDEISAYVDLAREMAAALEFTPEDTEAEINLSQSVTASMEGSGEYTLYYPEGWVGVADGETIMVANRQATLDKALEGGDVIVEPGEVAVTAMALPKFAFSFFGIEEGGSMTDAIAGFAALLSDEEATTVDFAAPEPFDADGRSAALIAGTVTENEITYGAILIAVEVEGGIGLIMTISHADEVASHKATIRAMAAAFEFTPEQ